MKIFFCIVLLFAVAIAVDPVVCSWCNTLVSQIEQLQTRYGRDSVTEYIEELCSIATDEAKEVCDGWYAYGIDKVIDGIMDHQDSQELCTLCELC
ncbi:Two tm domain protein [Entamoeba marina]